MNMPEYMGRMKSKNSHLWLVFGKPPGLRRFAQRHLQ